MAPRIDDITLTAYALGELDGAERAAVAAHLAASAPARRYVAEVRATANLVSDELARENLGGLTQLQHAAIEQRIERVLRTQPARPPRRAIWWERGVWAMSLAASIAIVAGVASVLGPYLSQHFQTVAQKQPAPKDINATRPKVARHDATSVPRFPEPAVPEEWTPLPDDALAARGSGREEAAPKDAPLAGVQSPAEGVAPDAQVARTTDANDHPSVAPPPRQAEPGTAIKIEPIPPKVDRFANLPHDALAPGHDAKVNNATAGSAVAGTQPSAFAGDAYAHLVENPFVSTSKENVSGFSAGVDTASYSNVRRFLAHGKLPPKDAVRVEEMLNYFPLRPISATGAPDEAPLVVQAEIAACPWKPENRLARIALQARDLPADERPPVNLVFVVDVSKSMRSEKSKLPLLKQAIRMTVGRLTARDRVALVAYSVEPGVVLAPTAADDKATIWAALDRLESGGRMEGGQGIDVAYDLASRNYAPLGVNRVVLATDGAWSIGTTDRSKLADIVAQRARGGVSLTVLGVGMNNLKDATMQKLAAAAGGSYAYLDTLAEARKVLADQVNGALVPVARDVKVRVTFNRDAAVAYRLIGYERRGLSREQMDSQSHRGGELGAGQGVTALYEVIPAGGKSAATRPAEMLSVAVAYKDATSSAPHALEATGIDAAAPLPRASNDFRFSAAVAEFGLLLRDSDYKANATWSGTLDLALDAAGPDDTGYRQEFIGLVRKAKALASR